MPSRGEITRPSNRRSMRSSSYFSAVPHELEIRPVRTPRSWKAATASIISSSGPRSAQRRSIRFSLRSSSSPSAAPNCRSKSASSIWPSSRPKSSPRAVSSSRNAWRTKSGSRPSRSQKPANAVNTLVVSTPPKSTSNPRRGLSTEGRLLGALGEHQHALAELLEVGVVGRARDRPLVVALHEDDRLPQRQRLIPADVGHRAAAALLVARDELLARREAVLPRDAGELEHPERRVVARDPQRAQVAEVGQRIADRPHLPVEDRHERGRRLEAHHHVAQAVVAVDDRGGRRLREVGGQPPTDLLDLRDLAGLVVLPQAGEAA